LSSFIHRYSWSRVFHWRRALSYLLHNYGRLQPEVKGSNFVYRYRVSYPPTASRQSQFMA
jgi:hypothetical protein